MKKLLTLLISLTAFFSYSQGYIFSVLANKGSNQVQQGTTWNTIKAGTKIYKGNSVKVHYKGELLDGTVFDSSFKRNQPIEFSLGVGQVIPGWDEGIALLNKGAKATLIIPSDLAYGAAGAGGVIPPNATLKFEVELVDFK